MIWPPTQSGTSFGPGGTVALARIRQAAGSGRGPGRGANGAPEFRELLLRQDPCELRRARWLADTVAAEHGLDGDEQFRFTFAANEAVANAIEHGAASPDGHIVVRCSSDGADLVFEVRDWGSFMPGVAPADEIQDRGRGLALMAAMVDEVDVSPLSDSTVVRLMMRAGPSAVAA